MALAEHRSGPFTVEDVWAIPDDCFRYELLDGVLIVSPSPYVDHQRVVIRLALLLTLAGQPDYETLPAPLDWKISNERMFEPDILVIRSDDPAYKRIEHPPLLAVEVLSPSSRIRDWNDKRVAYGEAGLPVYWIVDPAGPSLTVFELEGETLVQRAQVTGEEAYMAQHPFSVEVVPARLVR
ncbi:MAG: Uma2 family endonuclease [Acidimicrobiales bacterium]